MKDYCVDLIYKLGAIDDSKKVEEALYQEVMKEIEKLGGNPILVETFNKLHSITFDETYFPDVNSGGPSKTNSRRRSLAM